MILKRGEVWLAAPGRKLSPGAPEARPFLVVSPPELHDHLRTVIVAPVAASSHPAPFRIPLRIRGEKMVALLDQLRTLDKSTLIRRTGAITPASLADVLATLQQAFAP